METLPSSEIQSAISVREIVLRRSIQLIINYINQLAPPILPSLFLVFYPPPPPPLNPRTVSRGGGGSRF